MARLAEVSFDSSPSFKPTLTVSRDQGNAGGPQSRAADNLFPHPLLPPERVIKGALDIA